MAVYAASVTSLLRASVKVDQVTGVAFYGGEVNITNYNPTLAAITGISGKFKSILSCVAAVSDAGYLFEWIDASNAFKVYYFDYNAAGDGAAIEALVDTDVGSAHFQAFGLI